MEDLEVPKHGFTKSERAWLAEVVEAIKTARAVAGKDVKIDNHDDKGQVIGASDCSPCA